MGLLNLCFLFLIFVSFGYTHYLIFALQILDKGQEGILALSLSILFFILCSLLFVVFLTKNFIFKSYLKFSETGLELKYITRRFQKIEHSYEWSEISKIYDKVGATQYELIIETKESKEKILVPFEIWQSIFRVSKIKKSLSKYPVNINFNTLPRAILIFGDVVIITFLVIFFGIILFGILSYYR